MHIAPPRPLRALAVILARIVAFLTGPVILGTGSLVTGLLVTGLVLPGRVALAQDDPAPSPRPIQPAAQQAASGEQVLRVTGDDVNLRSGPSIDYHEVGKAARDTLLVRVGADDDFVRARVPGGPVVYVFEALVDWEDGALRATVTADDVLMRATPSQAYYPLHDQKLRRGDSLIVLGAETSEDGRWYRVLAPERIHVWIHGRYAESAGLRADAPELIAASLARLDALTDGRTRTERESVEAARRAVVVARLDVLDGILSSAAATEQHAEEAGQLAADEPSEDLARRAAELQTAITRSIAERAATAERERLARMKAELEAARDEQKAREEAHRRKLEEIQQRKQRAGRGAPLLTGIVRVRGSRIWVETEKAEALDLRSLRFRLADYSNRQVRIWGTREKRDSGGDRIEVDSIEIVGTEGR